ncbi:MAG TPA: glycosyltransferase family 2 protein [Aggregatilineales bacterium]|nr:glycosyltransferase family 2 protein [Aggregatilineales bacterium]
MPYQSSGGRKNSIQIGVGRSIWGGNPPPPVSERVLDGIPGCMAWISLLFSVILAVAFPRTMLLIAAVIAAYNALRFIIASHALVRGGRLIRQAEQTHWYQRYLADAGPEAMAWDDVKHIVLVPNYKEPLEIMRKTLDNLSRQYEARKRMTVVLAMEASEPDCERKASGLIEEYRDRFAHIFYTVHPTGLPGEIRGKGSNQSWASRWIKRKMVEELRYDVNTLVVTTMDADTIWHPDYFEAVTYYFAVSPRRYLTFWQAPIRYHGNIWDINPLLRIINAYSGGFELAYLASPWWKPMTMSSFSLSLRLLESSGFWEPDVIADDWHMYIQAFFAGDAEVGIQPVMLPFLATATTGDSLWDAIRNRYLQSLRHAWGSKETGYIVAKMLEHPELEFLRSFRLLIRVAHDVLLAGAGWIIITLGSQLPILLHPQVIPPLERIYTDPILMLLTFAGLVVVVMGIFFWYQDIRVRPPRTRPATLRERVLTLLSFPLLPVLTVIFLALPVLEAQTRLLVGITLEFRVSRKI